jgi:hypothetical protein
MTIRDTLYYLGRAQVLDLHAFGATNPGSSCIELIMAHVGKLQQ